MHVEQWVILLCPLGGVLFGLAAAFSRIRRLYLAMPAVVLFLMVVYEIRMDRWEKTVTAAIRLVSAAKRGFCHRDRVATRDLRCCMSYQREYSG